MMSDVVSHHYKTGTQTLIYTLKSISIIIL